MASLLAEQTLCGRGSTDFNHSWEFLLSKDLKDAEEIPNHNAPFRAVKLPHDWSVEFPFDEVNGEGCTGFLPGGMGWYRKNFKLSLQPDERAYIYFDGVYNRSEHWINGRKLGYHPYGYSPFYWDITNYLNDENQFIVKVDRTRLADSRWYTGSGIYRDVKLVVENNLHIPKWGTFITTPSVNTDQSSVVIKVEVENHFGM